MAVLKATPIDSKGEPIGDGYCLIDTSEVVTEDDEGDDLDEEQWDYGQLMLDAMEAFERALMFPVAGYNMEWHGGHHDGQEVFKASGYTRHMKDDRVDQWSYLLRVLVFAESESRFTCAWLAYNFGNGNSPETVWDDRENTDNWHHESRASYAEERYGEGYDIPDVIIRNVDWDEVGNDLGITEFEYLGDTYVDAGDE